MNDYTISTLKQYFSRAYSTDYFGQIIICFPEIGIKFNEKGAVLTDLTSCNHLSVGDWCQVGGHYFGASNNLPREGVDWSKTRFEPRMILAFFEIEGRVMSSVGNGKVKRIFCATGVLKKLQPELDWKLKISTPYAMGDGDEKFHTIVDAAHFVGKKNHPIKLIWADLLTKATETWVKSHLK